MTSVTVYTGNITVTFHDKIGERTWVRERTYKPATRARQFYRAIPEPVGDTSAAAQLMNCHACAIDGSDGKEYCVGIAGGCPRAIREAT